jgi:hypothetical protein
VRYGDRSFSSVAPKLWNALPVTIKDAKSLVEIGSVVSEEKIFLNFIPLFSNLHKWSKSAKVQSS